MVRLVELEEDDVVQDPLLEIAARNLCALTKELAVFEDLRAPDDDDYEGLVAVLRIGGETVTMWRDETSLGGTAYWIEEWNVSGTLKELTQFIVETSEGIR